MFFMFDVALLQLEQILELQKRSLQVDLELEINSETR